ncbi:MAG: hypothetical protein LAQ30_10250 [Acidobacteriia bacterium]|nr:hypothetical protein [Terriglobia bacterium]
MTPPRESRFRRALFVSLAGLEAGMIGALLLLGWLGVAAKWHRRSFWAPENLMASVFYGADAIRGGFSSRTVSGLALYLLLYSVLGALFAFAVQARLPRFRTALLGVLFALSWYYLSFQVLWRTVAPLITRLHIEAPTIWGHVIYGAMLGRFPVYFALGEKEQSEAPPAGSEADG